MFKKSFITIAVLSALSVSASAETIPTTGWEAGIPTATLQGLANGDLTFTGTGAESLVMTQEAGSATVHPESPMINGYGHKLTLDNIKSLSIKGTGTDGKWNSAIYTNTSKPSAISIVAKDAISVEGASMAVHALDGTIDLSADQITLKGGNAIVAQVEGEVTVNAGSNLTIEGTSTAVFSRSFGDQAGNHAVTLNAKDMSITSKNGSALATDNKGAASLTATNTAVLTGKTGINSTGGKVSLAGKDFKVIGTDGTAIKLTDNAGLTLDAPKLTADGSIDAAAGVVTIAKADTVLVSTNDKATVNIGELKGENLTIEVDHIVTTPDTATVDIQKNGLKNTNVRFSARAIDNFSADEAAQAMKDAVDLGTTDGTDKGTQANGVLTGYGTNFTTQVDAAGKVTTTGSDITKSTMDMAAMTLIAWRNETTTLNDRMSTLRTSPEQYGAWARWNGGEYKYDARQLSNKFNTIEVGGDIAIGGTPWIVGGSLAYTKGEGEFVQGETNSDAYSGALYALWSHESGSFVDLVMKAGRIETDYDFYNLHGGAFDAAKIKQNGFIMGVETGHRFNLTDMFYVEPQIQMTYSRLSGVDETTTQRTVNLEASDSLIGRVGVMAGINCPQDKGSAYVRISGLRDFRGDIDGSFTTNGNTYSIHQGLDDSWFEFAVGGSFKFTDRVYGFVDIQKSTGADIELDWRTNVGLRAYF